MLESTKEIFDEVFEENYTATLSDGSIQELVENGSSK